MGASVGWKSNSRKCRDAFAETSLQKECLHSSCGTTWRFSIDQWGMAPNGFAADRRPSRWHRDFGRRIFLRSPWLLQSWISTTWWATLQQGNWISFREDIQCNWSKSSRDTTTNLPMKSWRRQSGFDLCMTGFIPFFYDGVWPSSHFPPCETKDTLLNSTPKKRLVATGRLGKGDFFPSPRWQLKYLLFSPQKLGKWSNLTSIFFKGVGSTTNQEFWRIPVSFLAYFPRHPMIFSDETWRVQSLPKSIAFRFHYHSQKVIGCQGFKMLKCLVCGHVTTTKCSLNGLFHDEMVRTIWFIKTWHEWRWIWGQVVVSNNFKWVGSTTNQLTWTGIMQDEGNTCSTPLAIILDLQAWAA